MAQRRMGTRQQAHAAVQPRVQCACEAQAERPGLEVSAGRQVKLFPLIATPCYGNVLCLNYLSSVVRLLYAKRDVVAGIYQLKHEYAGFPFDIATLGPVDGQGFAEVREAPTGFMCIAGDVFTRMHRCGISRHEFFDNMIADDEYLTEDFAFCRRWRALGGAVHVDTKCALSHQGTKLYTGTPEWPSSPTTIS